MNLLEFFNAQINFKATTLILMDSILSQLDGALFFQVCKRPSINDVTHLGGRGICQKVTLLQNPI